MKRLSVLILLASGLCAAAQEATPVFRAGFAEVDITPPMGTPKQGSNSKTVASSVLDPLYARATIAVDTSATSIAQAVERAERAIRGG